MKETYIIKSDGTKVYTRDDNAPQMRKVMGEQKSQGSNMNLLRQKLGGMKQNPQGMRNAPKIAQMGRAGDTELAHVNPYEKMLLKMLGGSGTINPKTGLREFAAKDYLERYHDVATDQYFGSNPYEHWQQYGQKEGRIWDLGGGGEGGHGGGTEFNFPLDIMPTSKSTSSSSNYTGLPQSDRDTLMSAITPQLQSAIANMPQNIDAYTNQALGSYQQMMQNALRSNLPKTITNLANRGIISSTEGQNALSQTMSDAAIDASNKGYQTAMQQALLKANMPTILGQLAELGKYSTAKTASSSESKDPTAMYKIMADMIGGMM